MRIGLHRPVRNVRSARKPASGLVKTGARDVKDNKRPLGESPRIDLLPVPWSVLAFAGETQPSQFEHALQCGLLGCPVFRRSRWGVGSVRLLPLATVEHRLSASTGLFSVFRTHTAQTSHPRVSSAMAI